MLNFSRFQLNSEQQALIPVYRQKWQEIAVKNKKIDRSLATQAINAAYEFIELSQPDIIFFSNPSTALEYIYQEVQNNWGKIEDSSLGNPIAGNLLDKLLGKIKTQIPGEILEHLQGNLDDGLATSIASEIASKFQESQLIALVWAHAGSLMMESFHNSDLDNMSKNVAKIFLELFFKFGFVSNVYVAPFIWQMHYKFTDFIQEKKLDSKRDSLKTIGNVLFTGNFNNEASSKYQLPTIEMSATIANVLVPEVMADYGYYIDYCHEVLDCDLEEIRSAARDANKWQIFCDLITNCGWIFPYEKVAIVCDKN